MKKIIDDPSIAVKPVVGFFSEPSRVSDTQSPAFLSIKKTINTLFPDVAVAPYLVLGATDSRHFADIAGQTFRFNPCRLAREDMKRIHGIDERISIKNFADFAAFYREIIRDTAR